MRLLKHNKAVRLKARRVGAENKPRERLSQQTTSFQAEQALLCQCI